MNTTPPDLPELTRLIESLGGGELSAAETARLETLVLSDPRLLRRYVRHMQLCASLEWERAGRSQMAAPFDSLLAAALSGASPQAARVAREPAGRASWWTRSIDQLNRPLAFSLIFAAMFLLAGLTLLRVLNYSQPELAAPPLADAPQLVEPSSAAEGALATLTTMADCRWEGASAGRTPGARLQRGDTLRLAAGLAELTYANGARVLLQGPARFRLEAADQNYLQRGRMVAFVPAAARGFAIRTDAVEVVDLGTEFGVEVPSHGDTEVVVFTGSVQVRAARGESDWTPLTAGQVVRVATSEDAPPQVTRLDAGAARFARSISRPTIAAPSAAPAASPWPRADALSLWLTAESLADHASGGPVARWESAGNDGSPRVARQSNPASQPTWQARVLGGQPAVRFAGDDYLALPSSDELGLFLSEYEIFLVAQSTSPATQFLIAGGVEGVEVHLNGLRENLGVRFIPHWPFSPEQASDMGASGQYSSGRPHLFHVRIDPRNNYRGVMSVDGQPSGDLTLNDSRNADRSAVWLGLRSNGQLGFHGDLAEVLIYRAALSDAERQRVEAHLAAKYGLTLVEPSPPRDD